jgi:uncharacterized damage-inducible protein DinB
MDAYINAMFKTNTDLVNKATEEIHPDHWFLKPGADSNHLMWVAGHMVGSRRSALKALGGEWTAPWGSLFARGGKQAPKEQCPSVEEIRKAWSEVSEKLAAALASAPADVLEKPAPKGTPSFDGKVGGLVAFLAFHETYHVGQVSYLKKWLGFGQTVG